MRRWLAFLVLLIATSDVYYPVRHHPFVNFDDSEYVTANLHVQSGLHWSTVRWAFTTFDFVSWYPLTWLSHTLDYQMFKLDPAGHHVTNVVLHVLNVLLLFWVLQCATGFTGRSFMVAAVFALHPLNVESVAWIAERKNLLSMLFFLLALGMYRWYASQPGLSRYLGVAFVFALGLMSKPQVITFPCVLLLWDYWPLGRMFADAPGVSDGTQTAERIPPKDLRWLVWEKVPLCVLSAGSAIVTMQASSVGGVTAGELYPFVLRLQNAIVCYARFVAKAFWPSHLALFYPYPNSLPLWQAITATVFLLGITTAVIALRRRRYLPVGWLWFLGTLLPMSGIVQFAMHSTADRFAYLPLIGLFILVCWGVAEWARQHRVAKWLLATVSALVLLALGAITHRQISYWADNVTLWTHAVQVTSNNYIAEDHLGGALMDVGNSGIAWSHFYWALKFNPNDPIANLNVGVHEQQEHDFSGAIEQYQKVLQVTQNAAIANAIVRAKASSNLGFVYRKLGDWARAQQYFESAVAQDPRFFLAWIGLGTVEQNVGDFAGAIQAYSQALQVQPNDDVAHLLLAKALEQHGDHQQAQDAVLAAQRLSGNFYRTQQVAALLLER